MLVIRFLRTGKKNQPFFRIVVTEKKNPPRGGKFLEILGFFNPLTKERKLKKERIQYWLNVGAQVSERVHNLLVEEKIIKEKKIPVHKRSKKQKEKEEIKRESSLIQEEKSSSEQTQKEQSQKEEA